MTSYLLLQLTPFPKHLLIINILIHADPIHYFYNIYFFAEIAPSFSRPKCTRIRSIST
ncbi:hypothetical protein BGX38DRAFT_1207881 [Terfezia claveryi]|nr:hypothetical protein BGX38DRAFT_1207881 [Terfezia claveryi]